MEEEMLIAISEENIEDYALWCNGIVVDGCIAFKDRGGVIRTAKIGEFIYREGTNSFKKGKFTINEQDA